MFGICVASRANPSGPATRLGIGLRILLSVARTAPDEGASFIEAMRLSGLTNYLFCLSADKCQPWLRQCLLAPGAPLRAGEERTDATTETAPARLVRGNNQSLIEGSVGDATSSSTNPPATLTTRESGPPPDGQRPRQATATSSPSPAAAIGSSSSSRSEAIAHGAWELSRLAGLSQGTRCRRLLSPLHHQPVWPPRHLWPHRRGPRRSQLSSARASRSARP